jgi:hypothetical protein
MADYYFQMDTDSDEFYLVAIFKDRETYKPMPIHPGNTNAT